MNFIQLAVDLLDMFIDVALMVFNLQGIYYGM